MASVAEGGGEELPRLSAARQVGNEFLLDWHGELRDASKGCVCLWPPSSAVRVGGLGRGVWGLGRRQSRPGVTVRAPRLAACSGGELSRFAAAARAKTEIHAGIDGRARVEPTSRFFLSRLSRSVSGRWQSNVSSLAHPRTTHKSAGAADRHHISGRAAAAQRTECTALVYSREGGTHTLCSPPEPRARSAGGRPSARRRPSPPCQTSRGRCG